MYLNGIEMKEIKVTGAELQNVTKSNITMVMSRKESKRAESITLLTY